MGYARRFRIQVFADGADTAAIKQMRKLPFIGGFTTNPTLMKKAGVKDYRSFARQVLRIVPDLPVSFEVLSDDFEAMYAEAKAIAAWGGNVYVKIPVTDTRGRSAKELIRRLSSEGVPLNVTAVLSLEQVKAVARVINPRARSIISLFAGRIADTGRDPCPYIRKAVALVRSNPNAQILWASSRELLNIFQAEKCGCHIITVTPDILRKISLIGKDLGTVSLDTVRMLHADGKASGYKL